MREWETVWSIVTNRKIKMMGKNKSQAGEQWQEECHTVWCHREWCSWCALMMCEEKVLSYASLWMWTPKSWEWSRVRKIVKGFKIIWICITGAISGRCNSALININIYLILGMEKSNERSTVIQSAWDRQIQWLVRKTLEWLANMKRT